MTVRDLVASVSDYGLQFLIGENGGFNDETMATYKELKRIRSGIINAEEKEAAYEVVFEKTDPDNPESEIRFRMFDIKRINQWLNKYEDGSPNFKREDVEKLSDKDLINLKVLLYIEMPKDVSKFKDDLTDYANALVFEDNIDTETLPFYGMMILCKIYNRIQENREDEEYMNKKDDTPVTTNPEQIKIAEETDYYSLDEVSRRICIESIMHNNEEIKIMDEIRGYLTKKS